MPEVGLERFSCPECQAAYVVAAVPGDAEMKDPPVKCLICQEAFPSKDDDAILKYFLVTKPDRTSQRMRVH